MAISQEQKVDFLLKKIGFTASKTGNATDATGLSGTLTPKAGFAEAIPSPLIIANTALWNESGSIPATPPGSDTTQVKVYAPAGALRMTVDSTVANNRAFIAYTTYNNTSSARLTNWIDTQFGPDYIIQVFVNDATSSSNKLNAGGSGNNDGWFFDYSAGVLNFNDTNVPTSVTSTNVYIVGYRYVGQTGAPTSGISTFSYLDLTVERNLDVGIQGGISTFRNNIDLNANLDVSGSSTFAGNIDANGDLDVDGHTNLDNVSIAGISTFSEGLFIPDDKKLEIGNAAGNGDLQLYYDSTPGESLITHTGPGVFKIEGNTSNNIFIRPKSGQNSITAKPNAEVELYYNGVQRFETTSQGIEITGHSELDNVNISGVTTAITVDVNGDLDVDGHTNLDNISVAGVSTFTGDATFSGNVSIGGTLTYEDVTNVDSVGLLTARSGIRVTGGVIEALAGENKIPSLYANMAALPSAGSYHGMFAHVHSTGRGYFAHAGAWYELVNADLTGRVGTGTESYFIDRLVSTSTTATSLNVTGVTTAVTVDINGDLDVDGHTNLDNVSIAGVTTFTGAITANGSIDLNSDLDVDGHTNLDNVNIVGVTTTTGNLNVTDGRILIAQSTAPQLRINSSTADGSSTRFTFGIATSSNNFINGASSNDACIVSPSNLLFGVSNTRKFRIKTNDVLTDVDFIPSANDATSLGRSNARWSDIFAVDANISGDIDVDGHTNLDNVSIAGVTTAAGTLRVGTGHTFHDNGNAQIAGIATVYNQLNIPRFYGSGNPTTQLLTLGADEIRMFQRWNGSTSTIEFKSTGAFIGHPATGASSPLTIQSGSFTRFKFINGNGGSGTYAEFNKAGTGGYVQLHGGANTKVLTTDANGVNILKDIDVDGHTELDNVNIVGVTTAAGHVLPSADVTYDLGSSSKQWRNLYADNIVSAPGNGFIGPDLTVRNFKATGISTFGGNARFNSTIAVHDGTTGSNGQYLKSVGTGVTWASFPTLRTRDTIVASAGQTSFTFTYTVNFIDVFVNGIKLTDSEFTATNGTSVVLAVGCFVGDIVELVSYNTVSTGAGGGGGTLNNIVEDTSPQLGANLDLFNKTITGTGGINITGVVTATTFIGDGSGLTGITASGTGVVIRNNDTTVGTAGTINFGDDLSVTPIVAGIVTVGIDTSQINLNKLNVSGISTFNGNIDINADLDVDGHTNLDNVSIAGVTTITGSSTSTLLIKASDNNGTPKLQLQDGLSRNNFIAVEGADNLVFATDEGNAGADSFMQFRVDGTERLRILNTGATVTGTLVATGADINGDIDVDGHTELDNVNIAGVVTATTFKGALQGTSGTFSSDVDITGDLDVDGHTNLDNVSIAGVVTATTFSGSGASLTGIANANIAANAAIAGSKINTNFGSAGMIATGSCSFGNISISNVAPKIFLTDSDTDSDFSIRNMHGVFGIHDQTNSADRLTIASSGNVSILKDLDVDGHTNLDNVSVAGVVTATSFVGDGSGLTGITASGSGVVIKHDGSTVGTAGTINFSTNLDVSAISAGIVTVTASGSGGVSLSGSTNNTVATVTGANALIGEANLTFDGSTLAIAAGSDDNKIQIDGSAPYIQFREGTTNKANIQWSPSGHLQITNEEDSSRLRIKDLLEFSTDGSTFYTVWHAGNMGPSSNLNADLLDGQQGSYYTNAANLTGTLPAIDGSNLTGVTPAIGITTNLSGTFTASAGSPSTINTFGYGSGDIVVEYTVFIKNGSNYQSQKLLAMRDGTTIHSTQFAIMYSSSLLVQLDTTISSGNILLRATPETGVSGSTTYKVKREVM